MTTCTACGKEVDTTKPEGWSGRHRYGCIGPSTWSGLLASYAGGRCWCGAEATIQLDRGLYQSYACSPAHARSRKLNKTVNPFSVFVTACYPKGVPK